MLIQFPKSKRSPANKADNQYPAPSSLSSDNIPVIGASHPEGLLNENRFEERFGLALTLPQRISLLKMKGRYNLTDSEIRYFSRTDCLTTQSAAVDIYAPMWAYLAGVLLAGLWGLELALFSVGLIFLEPVRTPNVPALVAVYVAAAVLLYANRWYFVQPWWIQRKMRQGQR